jgi:hypothetical protein
VQEKSLLASQILQIFSYLHNDEIPREIFKRTSSQVNDIGDDGGESGGSGNNSDYKWISSRMSKPVLELLETWQGGERDSGKFEEAIDYLQSYSALEARKGAEHPSSLISMTAEGYWSSE